ncbi:MAG: GMC family oxidoreductase [Spirochaetota bacterium]|nr:GMC family oxidoreductase [Spirochaetota bacterium]
MKLNDSYEYIVVGSGFGGAFAAYNLSKAGKEVLVVERGRWVQRDDTCWDERKLHIDDPIYRGLTPTIVNQKWRRKDLEWPDDTVGGMSTFYGAAAFRLRESDFEGPPRQNSDQKERRFTWPFNYQALSPYYDEAEALQNVAGVMGEDITEPQRESDYPQTPPKTLSLPSQKIKDAALDIGLHPFHIPLAINFSNNNGKAKCILCGTCDHYLCKIEAKNDLSVSVLPYAMKHGARIISNTRVVKINLSNGKVVSVDLVDQASGERKTVNTKVLIVACGALSTPHLLLTSGIDTIYNGGSFIGRSLMRHISGVVCGVFPFKTNPEKKFQKQIAISDFYYGDIKKRKSWPPGNWGIIQDVSCVGKGYIKTNAPWGLRNIGAFLSDYSINQLCIAEDIPHYRNRVFVDWKNRDIFGMPTLRVYHRYNKRDFDAINALYRVAKKILKRAGSHLYYIAPIETFSHALGTCRFGESSATSVLDPECRVWGVKNLYVLDASFMPSGGSVNPSLTIAANSLRVSDILSNI